MEKLSLFGVWVQGRGFGVPGGNWFHVTVLQPLVTSTSAMSVKTTILVPRFATQVGVGCSTTHPECVHEWRAARSTGFSNMFRKIWYSTVVLLGRIRRCSSFFTFCSNATRDTMRVQVVVVLVRLECLLKGWFEDWFSSEERELGLCVRRSADCVQPGLFFLVFLRVSYCCCTRCAWSRGCRSMYKSEAVFSDETHLCHLLMHLSQQATCAGQLCCWVFVFGITMWQSWIECRSAIHGISFVRWESANIKYVRIECFRFSCTPDACLVLRFVLRFRFSVGSSGSFLKIIRKVVSHFCLRLCKANFRRLCWKFHVLCTGKSYSVVTGVHPLSSLANKGSCSLFGTLKWFFLLLFGNPVSCWIPSADSVAWVSGAKVFFCHVVCDTDGFEYRWFWLSSLWQWVSVGCVETFVVRFLLFRQERINVEVWVCQAKEVRRCAWRNSMARFESDSWESVPSTSKVCDKMCHRQRSSSRVAAWFLLSTRCDVERGMCLANGCVIRSCGLRSERVSHGKFFQGFHACGSIVRDRINCWSVSGFADLVVSAIFLDGFGVPEVFTSAIQVIVVDVHE